AGESTRMRTFSWAPSFLTISPYTQGMGANFPGQSSRLCGQAIHVAAWGSHSAGITGLFTLDESLVDPGVGIDPPVPQEGPAAPDLLDARRVDPAHHDFFPIRLRGGDHHAEGIREKRPAPELDAGAVRAGFLRSRAVDRRDIDAVGDRVAALDGRPCVA